MFESQPSYVVCILRFGIELTTQIYFLYRRDAYLSRQRLSNLPLRSLRWRRAKTSRTPRTSETVCGPPFHELHATSHNFACLHSLCPRLLTSDDIRFHQIGYLRLYGEATTSSSYGGYGGNENNFDKFKYYYDIPVGWTQDTVNKVEKSTNGTDTRWSNPKLNSEKVYCVTLTGYNRLKRTAQVFSPTSRFLTTTYRTPSSALTPSRPRSARRSVRLTLISICTGTLAPFSRALPCTVVGFMRYFLSFLIGACFLPSHRSFEHTSAATRRC